MENLFISYRRDDSAAYAGRICDRLGAFIGAHRVFMDVEDIQLGQNFAQAIENTLKDCSHVLVVIGPHWHDILQARAQKPGEEDYVLHEIAGALALKKTVVPVFVGGATAAMLTALPPSLADLPFHQAVELHDSSFNDDCNRLAAKLQLAPSLLRKPLVLIAVAAVLGFLIFLAAQAGLGPWHAAHERQLQVARMLSTAQTHVQEAEYESAFQSDREALALEPNNSAALDGEVKAAMLWLEHFHVLTPEGQKSEDIAAPILAQLNTVLTAGLARTNGKDSRAADILAHLGWLHYMNEKIAFKEFGNAERYFAQAIAIEPANVYAHAFWGNWLLQTRGDSAQALKHFAAAHASNSQRDLVRSLELGGLLGDDDPGMHVAFLRALNQVRVNNEPLDPDIRSRVYYLYEPDFNSAEEMQQILTALPPEDAWKTFVWLTPDRANDHSPPILKDFVHASLTEIAGNRSSALAEFKQLAGILKTRGVAGRIPNYTAEAIRRLSR